MIPDTMRFIQHIPRLCSTVTRQVNQPPHTLLKATLVQHGAAGSLLCTHARETSTLAASPSVSPFGASSHWSARARTRIHPFRPQVMGFAASSSGISNGSQAYTEIAEAVSTYFAALHKRDAELMKTVFHPSAHLKRLDDEDVVQSIPSERFFQIVSVGEPTPEAIVAEDKILNIELLQSGVAAMAQVQISLPPKRYTDFLSFLKIDGKWQIISKVFTAVDMEAPTYREEMPFVESHSEIADALTLYFYSLHLSDPELVQQVMHPSSGVYTCEQDQLYARDMDQFCESIAQRPASTDSRVTKYDKICAVSKSGPKTAMAKVQIGFPQVGRLFTDHLSLLKVMGKWTIVSKTYTYEPLELETDEGKL
eukprot:4867280-Pyramimonas_sp.AAC.1